MNFATTIHCLVIAETAAAESMPNNPYVLFTAGIAWAAIWIQVIVVQFFNKGEQLHQDYWARGQINTALAAIETDRLIPALSRMFNRAIEEQADKRKRPENEMEDLLQSVEFAPDLQTAQVAMSAMDGIRQGYAHLKVSAARLWKWGFAHALLTPLLPAIYVFLVPIDPRWQPADGFLDDGDDP